MAGIAQQVALIGNYSVLIGEYLVLIGNKMSNVACDIGTSSVVNKSGKCDILKCKKKEQTMLALVRDEAGHEDVGYFL